VLLYCQARIVDGGNGVVMFLIVDLLLLFEVGDYGFFKSLAKRSFATMCEPRWRTWRGIGRILCDLLCRKITRIFDLHCSTGVGTHVYQTAQPLSRRGLYKAWTDRSNIFLPAGLCCRYVFRTRWSIPRQAFKRLVLDLVLVNCTSRILLVALSWKIETRGFRVVIWMMTSSRLYEA